MGKWLWMVALPCVSFHSRQGKQEHCLESWWRNPLMLTQMHIDSEKLMQVHLEPMSLEQLWDAIIPYEELLGLPVVLFLPMWVQTGEGNTVLTVDPGQKVAEGTHWKPKRAAGYWCQWEKESEVIEGWVHLWGSLLKTENRLQVSEKQRQEQEISEEDMLEDCFALSPPHQPDCWLKAKSPGKWKHTQSLPQSHMQKFLSQEWAGVTQVAHGTGLRQDVDYNQMIDNNWPFLNRPAFVFCAMRFLISWCGNLWCEEAGQTCSFTCTVKIFQNCCENPHLACGFLLHTH